MAGELVDLVVLLVAALDAAHVELTQLAEGAPVPPDVLEALEQRDALAATLRRMVERADVREAAQAIYREELAKVTRSVEWTVPVLPEVVEQLGDVRELLRRAALLDRELADALVGAGLRSMFAG